MPLTPADVRNTEFSTTRMRPGYDQEEVDAFLDQVENELDRLIRENEELRAKLAESLRGGQLPIAPLSNRPGGPGADVLALESSPPASLERPPVPGVPPPAENPVNAAARVLAMAQQTVDQAITDARREADETVAGARREADDLLGQARRQAEQVTSEARARAETLERDAHERHRQAMGSLVQQREDLERRIADLRAFEEQHRARLRAYLSGVLHDLDDGDANGTRQGGPAAASTGVGAVQPAAASANGSPPPA